MIGSESLPLAGVDIQQDGSTLRVLVAERGMIERTIRLSLADPVKHLIVEAGVGSRCRLWISHETPSSDISFSIGANAFMDVFHRLTAAAGHIKIRYSLNKHASLNVWSFGDSRELTMEQQVIFEEEHAFAALHGLSLLSGTERATQTIRADHRAGYGVSRQFYKNIVTDRAVSAFDSLVEVSKNAVKSDSKQMNKNLVLSGEAKAISKPELKIEADEVACSHGSATGQMDENALFYLRSRGLDVHQSQVLLMDGFAKEVFDDVHDETAKNEITQWVRQKLTGMRG